MSKIAWSRTVIAGETKPCDFVATDEQGRRVGRIYACDHGPRMGQWFWSMQAEPPDFDRNRAACQGTTDTKQEAADAVRAAYHACLIKTP